MSESSAEKTKRNVLKCLGDFHWEQQTSIYPNLCLVDYEWDKELARTVIPECLNQFKDKLRRAFNEVGMLVILRKLAKPNDAIKNAYPKRTIVQLYVTVYSSQKLNNDKMGKVINTTFNDSVKFNDRSVTDALLADAIDTIKHQELHDLKSLSPDHLELKRLTKLNSKYLIKKDSLCMGRGRE
ncbi:MAG: hypothetical protein EOO69_13260 [Moraxellaceae bacterium]|nr:MAG: hypothetical protein EOO69_13260 [Moraxellaceae bacterium]